MMTTTRQLIVEHIQSRRVATAAEISRVLRITPANARHHLNILLKEGVIEAAGQELAAGRGRPTQLYRLTLPARQHSLDHLASALLDELAQIQEQGSEEKQEISESCLKRIALRLHSQSSAPRNLTQSLTRAVSRLNELNYAARWEAHAQAPRLILGHCPFSAIIQEHPELCRMDAHLLEGLVGAQVHQMARLAPEGRGERVCVFLVGKTPQG